MYDCQRCGACCTNPIQNRVEGFVHYVEIDPADRILGRADLVRKLVTRDAAGVPHLRLDRDGRCLSLHGRIGDRVKCNIYRDRPSPCRRVESGSEACHRARRDAGLEAV